MTVSPLPGSGKVQAARGGTVQQFGVGRISDTDTDTDQQRWVYKTKEHADIHLGDTWRYCTMLLSMCTERGHCGDVMIHTQHRYVLYTYIRLYTYIYTMECDVLECSGISNVGRLMGQTWRPGPRHDMSCEVNGAAHRIITRYFLFFAERDVWAGLIGVSFSNFSCSQSYLGWWSQHVPTQFQLRYFWGFWDDLKPPP